MILRNSAMANQDYGQWCYESNFTYEASNESFLLSSEFEEKDVWYI